MLAPNLGQDVRVQSASAAPGAGEPSSPGAGAGLPSHWTAVVQVPNSQQSPGMASGDSLPVASMMSRKFSEA